MNIKKLAAPAVAVGIVAIVGSMLTFGPAFAGSKEEPTPAVAISIGHTSDYDAARDARAVTEKAAADAAAAVAAAAAAQAAADAAAAQAAAAQAAAQKRTTPQGPHPIWIVDSNPGDQAGGYWDTSQCGQAGATLDANGHAICAG